MTVLNIIIILADGRVLLDNRYTLVDSFLRH